MTERAIVGAVIPVRNRWRKTQRFLQQFCHQEYGYLRIYVVDSSSSDSTGDELTLIQDEKLVLIQASDGDFWAGATNKGVERALEDGCEFILTINDDCVPVDDLVRRLVETSIISGYKIVGSRINFLDDPSRVWSVGAFNVWGTHRLFQLRENEVCEEDIYRRADFPRGYAEVDMMPGNGVLIHRSVFKNIGLFDEIHYPHYHADSEFILRARKVGGYQAIVDYNAVLYNDVGTSGASSSLVNRPISAWQRRLGLFFSRRSERRLLTVVHYLANYCPRNMRISTLISYVWYAILRFQFPRLKCIIDQLQTKRASTRKQVSFLFSEPKMVAQMIVCSIRRWRNISNVNRAHRRYYELRSKKATR